MEKLWPITAGVGLVDGAGSSMISGGSYHFLRFGRLQIAVTSVSSMSLTKFSCDFLIGLVRLMVLIELTFRVF